MAFLSSRHERTNPVRDGTSFSAKKNFTPGILRIPAFPGQPRLSGQTVTVVSVHGRAITIVVPNFPGAEYDTEDMKPTGRILLIHASGFMAGESENMDDRRNFDCMSRRQVIRQTIACQTHVVYGRTATSRRY